MFESERREKEESQEPPSKIYEVLSVEACRAKNESSSHRQRLRISIENAGFHRGSKRGVGEIKGFRFKKCPQGFLGFFLHSKRQGILPTWFIFHFRVVKWSNVQVPIERPSPRQTMLRLGGDMELPREERGLCLGEGKVRLGELGEGIYA